MELKAKKFSMWIRHCFWESKQKIILLFQQSHTHHRGMQSHLLHALVMPHLVLEHYCLEIHHTSYSMKWPYAPLIWSNNILHWRIQGFSDEGTNLGGNNLFFDQFAPKTVRKLKNIDEEGVPSLINPLRSIADIKDLSDISTKMEEYIITYLLKSR